MAKVDKSALYKERIVYKQQKYNEETRYNRARKFKIDKENLEASLTTVERQIDRNFIPKVFKEWLSIKEKILYLLEKKKHG